MILPFNVMSKHDIDNAATIVEQYKQKVIRLSEELPKVLAEYGAGGARMRFNAASYDILVNGTKSTPNITVTIDQRENGWAIIANGQEVCFVEFGAGVYYNGSESYLRTRPPGIVGIGEYGMGNGKRNAWGFYEDGKLFLTRGTPAQNCMYFTVQELRNRLVETARSILNGND